MLNDDLEPITIIGQPTQELSLWTDGSLIPTTSDMGAASLCLNTDQEEVEVMQTRPPPGLPSTANAELSAILQSFININTSNCVTIHTDSQAAIDGINAFIRTTDIYIGRKLNQTNSLVIQCIVESIRLTPRHWSTLKDISTYQKTKPRTDSPNI